MLDNKMIYRAIIAELHDSPRNNWTYYYASLIVFISIVLWPGQPCAVGHLIAGVAFFAALIFGIIALLTSQSQDYFLGRKESNGYRVTAAFLGAITCAVGYGSLETHFRLGGGGAPLGFALTSAKGLASFVSTIGFAGVIAAFTAELRGGRTIVVEYEPVEYFVQHQELKEEKNKFVKHLILSTEDGKLKKVSINLSATAGVLAESMALATKVREGDTVKMIEYRDYSFIVGIANYKEEAKV